MLVYRIDKKKYSGIRLDLSEFIDTPKILQLE